MHLSVYMAERKLRDEDVALAIGVARATVSRWRRGLIRPDWPAIEAIRIFSRNKITAEDWRFLEQQHPARRNRRRKPDVLPETSSQPA